MGPVRAEGSGRGRAPSPRRVRALAGLTALLTAVSLIVLAGPAASSAHAAGASSARGSAHAGTYAVHTTRVSTAQAAAASCAGRLVKRITFATGELRVYRNRQYVCALTLAAKPGARRAMAVSVQARGGRAAVDRGRFTRQAGPVTVHALNRCVRATGSVAGRSGATGWFGC